MKSPSPDAPGREAEEASVYGWRAVMVWVPFLQVSTLAASRLIVQLEFADLCLIAW